MLKKLLYLYNDGHNPFPKLGNNKINGKGGLGYHLPNKKLIGYGIDKHYDRDRNFLFEEDDGQSDDEVRSWRSDESEYNVVGRVEYDEDRDIKQIYKKGYRYDPELKEYYVDYIPDDNYDGNEIDRLEKQHKKERNILNLEDELTIDTNVDNDKEQNEIRDEIKDYGEKWVQLPANEKRILTQKINSKFDFTDDQKKMIDKLKKKNDPDKLYEYLKTQSFVRKDEEIIEGFEPDYTPKEKLPQESIDEIKTSEIVSEDVLPFIEYKDILDSYNDCKENPYKSLLGDDYINLATTTDENIVENLLYDNTGKYASGKDFEDKVLKNTELVKNILIATYGNDVDLKTVKINYEAQAGEGDLFTVFDAHAVSFKINGKDKEAFIEFKKYANYAPKISDLNVLFQSEEEKYNNFIYTKIDKINNINLKLGIAIEDNDKKEIKRLKKEINSFLKENDINDKEKMKKEFYEKLDPIGIGVKYTKFPPLPHNLLRPDKSVNSEEGYKYIMGYEKNTKRRQRANVDTHLKATKEDIDILIVTGLKNSMVVCNVSDLLKKYPDQNHIDYLKLKKTVYGTKQKGTKRIDYDHFNIPISYFKNVSLITNLSNQPIKKSKSKSKSKHLDV